MESESSIESKIGSESAVDTQSELESVISSDKIMPKPVSKRTAQSKSTAEPPEAEPLSEVAEPGLKQSQPELETEVSAETSTFEALESFDEDDEKALESFDEEALESFDEDDEEVLEPFDEEALEIESETQLKIEVREPLTLKITRLRVKQVPRRVAVVDMAKRSLPEILLQDKPLEFEVTFQLTGTGATELTRRPLTYHVQFFAQNQITREKIQLDNPFTSTLLEGKLSYTNRLPRTTLPQPGIYRFQVVTRLDGGHANPDLLELPFVQVI